MDREIDILKDVTPFMLFLEVFPLLFQDLTSFVSHMEPLWGAWRIFF